MSDEEAGSKADLLRLSAGIVAAYVSQNRVPPDAVRDLIGSVHRSLTGLEAGETAPPAAPTARQKPAVPISKSIQHDQIICLEDGKPLKMLKRYLRSRYDLSPEEYRRKWGLPPDYPMVARPMPSAAPTSPRRSASARACGGGSRVCASSTASEAKRGRWRGALERDVTEGAQGRFLDTVRGRWRTSAPSTNRLRRSVPLPRCAVEEIVFLHRERSETGEVARRA